MDEASARLSIARRNWTPGIAAAHVNLGVLLKNQGPSTTRRLSTSTRPCASIRKSRHAHYNRGAVLLASGRFPAGLRGLRVRGWSFPNSARGDAPSRCGTVAPLGDKSRW